MEGHMLESLPQSIEDQGENESGVIVSEPYLCEDNGEQLHSYKEMNDLQTDDLSQLTKPYDSSESNNMRTEVHFKSNDALPAESSPVVIGNDEGIKSVENLNSVGEEMHTEPEKEMESVDPIITNGTGAGNESEKSIVDNENGGEIESENFIENNNGTELELETPVLNDNNSTEETTPVPEEEDNWKPLKRGGKYKCKHCSKSFTRKDAVLNHMKNHTGKKPHQCETCGKTFGFKGNLNVHMRIHTGFKPFICDICGKSFSQKGNLNTHSTIHLKKHFDCHECSKCFADRKSLENHMKTHSPVSAKKSTGAAKPTTVPAKPPVTSKQGGASKKSGGRPPAAGKTYECMACGQCFGDQVSVVDHMMMNHTVENTC